MAHKKMLLFLMVGLLAMAFAVPATAVDRPAYALNPDAVPGWKLYNEAQLFNWTTDYVTSFSINAWYQIWINNNTWANATAGMLLMVVDFGQPVDNFKITVGPITLGPFDLWDIFVTSSSWSWFNNSAEEKIIPGLTKALVWRSDSDSIWWGLGYTGNYVIFCFGKGDETPPGNPFVGGLAAPVKSPAAAGASQSSIMSLMGAQAGAFPGGIPGFTVAPILITMAVLVTIIFLLRKDQLHLLK